jgi:hypothetical protein
MNIPKEIQDFTNDLIDWRQEVLSSYRGTIKRICDSNTFLCGVGARHPLPLAERLGSKHSEVAGP